MLETVVIIGVGGLLYTLARGWATLRQLDTLLWQRLRLDAEGAHLTLDKPTALGRKIAEVAARYVGVEEQPRGSNRGAYIDAFLRFVGLPPGNPWCTAFVSFAVHKAAEELGTTTDFPKTGWTPTLFSWAQRQNRLITSAEINTGVKPQEGWIALFYFPALGRVAHSGIVVKRLPLGAVVTIEGNTNDDGSREGYKVARRVRLTKRIYAFIAL
jgi:hypothetical protein